MNAVSKKKVVLFGAVPEGRKLVSQIDRDDVYSAEDVAALEHMDGQESISSIVVVAGAGDDFTPIERLYKQAVDRKLLVTTVVISGNRCNSRGPSASLAVLRKSSDMLTNTSDESYVDYLLDCLKY